MNMTTYLSIDIEADGPIPGPHSMLSFGAAAYQLTNNDKGWAEIATFKRNLTPLPGATPDPDTAAWWKTQPEAWEAATKDPVSPEQGMADFATWLQKLPGTVVVCGYPVTFDFLFVYWYYVRFNKKKPPFSHSGLDIKTLAMVQMNVPYYQATKRNMPRRWFRDTPRHTHDALDDARGQGILLMNILND